MSDPIAEPTRASPGELAGFRGLLAATCWLLVLTSCAGLGGFGLGGSPPCKDEDCPAGSREIAVGVERYCVLSCSGVLEDSVRCGGWGVGRFDGALVCLVQHHDPSTSSCVVVNGPPTTPPNEVCRALPHGCVCSDPACTWTGPERCAASDPQCGPEAFSGTCLDRVGYRPTATRRPAFGGSFVRSLDNPCTFDGECVNSGCGYQCLSTTRHSNMGYTCEGHGEWDRALADAFCGCVAGQCAWFVE